MATWTHLVGTTNTTDGTVFDSGAFTPAAGSLMGFYVTAAASVAANPTLTSIGGVNGATFTLISARAIKNGSVDTIYFFIANQLTTASPASMQVRFTTTDTSSACTINGGEAAGMSKTGLTAIKQAIGIDNVASGTAPATTFATAALTGNLTLFGVFNTVGVTKSPPASWTMQVESFTATPTGTGSYASRNSGFTGTVITAGSATQGACGALAVELDTSSSGSSYAASGTSTVVSDSSGNPTVVGGGGGGGATLTVAAADKVDTTALTVYPSNSFTPATGEMVLVVAAVAGSVMPAAAGTCTGSANGLTFTRIGECKTQAGTGQLYVFLSSVVGASPSAMTALVDVSGASSTGAIVGVARIAGMTKTGAAAVRAMAYEEQRTAVTTLDVNWAQAALTTNLVVAVMCNNQNVPGANVTPPAGFSEGGDSSFDTPAQGMEWAYRNSGHTSATVAWATQSAGAWSAIIVEFDTSGGGGATYGASGTSSVVSDSSGAPTKVTTATPENDVEMLIFDQGVWVPAEAVIQDANVWEPAAAVMWDGDELSLGADLATTSTTGWLWGGFGYGYPGLSFVPEAGGMRISWNPSPGQNPAASQIGLFAFEPANLIDGNLIRVDFIVNVPAGSPDVRLTQAFTRAGPYLTAKDSDHTLSLEWQWESDQSALFGIESSAAPGAGSVLVKDIKVFDQSSPPVFGRWVPGGAAPADTTPPSIPGAITATGVTTTQIQFNWGAATDNVGVTGYQIRVNGGSWTDVSATFRIVTGLSPSTAYTPEVRARDAAGNFGPIRTGSATTTQAAADTQAPTQPGAISSSNVTSSTITFSWGASTDNVGVTGYQIRLNGGAWASVGNVTSSQRTGLSPSTAYVPEVRAQDAAGNFSAIRTGASVSTIAAPTATMYVGAQWVTPTAAVIADNPELAPFAGMSRLNGLNEMERQLRVASGWSENPMMRMGHSFMNGTHNYNITGDSWFSQQNSRYPSMTVNFKPNGSATTASMNNMVAGNEDTMIINMITSLPTGKRYYLCYFHEPDETGGTFATAWREANARWAKLILDNRGARDIHPMICLTTWSFRPANSSIQAQFLSVTDEYEALGIDWVNDVVMGPDGYEDKAADVNGDCAGTFQYVFPVMYAQGWRRFGITETAATSKAGQMGNKTITAQDVALSDEWTVSLGEYAAAYNFEYVCWFFPVGSKGPMGDYHYTEAIKKAWADICHYRGPVP